MSNRGKNQNKNSKNKCTLGENKGYKQQKAEFIEPQFLEQIRFSQTNISEKKTNEIYKNMESNEWNKENGAYHDPIDIVIMPDGKYTSYDNKRLYCAKKLGVRLRARIHYYTDYADFSRVNSKKTWQKVIEERCRDARNDWSEKEKYGYENYPLLRN